MNRPTHIYNCLQDTIKLMEKKATAMETSMPSDPTGNGCIDKIPTGPAFAEYENEYNKLTPTPPDAGNAPDAALEEDMQAEHSGSDFDITISGEGDHAQDVCKDRKDDPSPFGTDMPADIEEAEKYAAYTRYSLEENIAEFNKAASVALRNIVGNYQNNVKTASVAIQVPNEILRELNNSSDNDLVKTAQEASVLYDSIVQGIALEKQAMAQLSKSDYDTFAGMDINSLSNTVVKMAEGCDSAAECAAGECAPSAEEAEALAQLPDQDLAALEQLDPATLDALLAELIGTEEGAAVEGSPEIAEAIDAVNATPEETLQELDAAPVEKLAAFIDKLAEDEAALANAIAAEDAGVNLDAAAPAAEDSGEAALINALANDPQLGPALEVLQQMPEEQIAQLDQLSPEELAQVIQEAAQVEASPEMLDGVGETPVDPGLLSQMAGGAGAPSPEEVGGEVSPDEAVNELSSAMTEQGLTPAELSTLGKQGSALNLSLRKYASLVQNLRDSGMYQYTYPKTKKAAAIRQRMNSFLREITRS